MKTVYIPKGETVHYESLTTEFIPSKFLYRKISESCK